MSAVTPPLAARSAVVAQEARIRFRRALTLTGMTLVAPGSAQLAAGNKRVGRVALRGTVVGACFVAALVLLGLTKTDWLVSLFTLPWFLGLVRFGLIVYAVAWAALIVDAWRISDPLGLAQRQRLIVTSLNGVLCLAVSGALLFASHVVAVQKDFITSVFGDGSVSDAEHGRYNVLLIGGDAGEDRWGMRPDSLTVASVDEETGRTVLYGLPRNLADVPFPKGSPMHEEFPAGFDCDGCYLNGVYTWAEDHKDLFPGVDSPGVEATRLAAEEITGLKINYYVMIDLRGFERLVNALGGVQLNVTERIPIGRDGDIEGYVEPGQRRLNGYETLWFARSRATVNDYVRMGRQKCVMNAMLQQLDPKKVITKFGRIASAGKQVVSTSLPASELDRFVELALRAKRLPVMTVSFVPPLVDTGDPDWKRIRELVDEGVQHAEALDGDGDTPDTTPVKRMPKQAAPSPDAGDGTDEPATTEPALPDRNTSEDLGQVC